VEFEHLEYSLQKFLLSIFRRSSQNDRFKECNNNNFILNLLFIGMEFLFKYNRTFSNFLVERVERDYLRHYNVICNFGKISLKVDLEKNFQLKELKIIRVY